MENGKSVVKNMSRDLELQYGRSYEKSSIFRMIQFYEEFPNFEKVATLSQQLTWSHFKELLPVNDELKRYSTFRRKRHDDGRYVGQNEDSGAGKRTE